MVDNVRQNPDMRDRFKCSECRRKKIKCTPRNRHFEITHQKCDNCDKHDDVPCGPSYKKRDDPAFAKSRNEVTANEEDTIRDTEDQPRAPIPRPTSAVHSSASVDGHNRDQPPLVTEESSEQRKRIRVASGKELRERASRKLEELNSLGTSYVFASQLYPISCACDPYNNHNEYPDTCTNTIRDELHSLFMTICQIGLQLHEQEKDGEAHGIFMKLVLALEKYPGMFDARKRGALHKIAHFYQDIGDQDEMEWLLWKAAQTHNASALPENPCSLVQSLTETSERASNVLLELLQSKLMDDEGAPLAISPIQRSAQHSNAGVTSLVLAQTNIDTYSLSALFGLQGIHVAATQGSEQNVINFLGAGAQVDVLDRNNQTPLFLAAAKGHEGCCAVLITQGADPNRRNRHGTTILEVAVKAGHFNIVKQLVDAGAEINPPLLYCASSPLQAAIESVESPEALFFYLMDKNGDVKFRRNDGKNAIDLAEERGLLDLAQIMRQKEQQGQQGLFEQPRPFSFGQSHLDPGPGVF